MMAELAELAIHNELFWTELNWTELDGMDGIYDPWWLKCFWTVSELFQNCFRTVQNCSELLTVQNWSELLTVQNWSELLTVQNWSELFRTGQNYSELFRTVQNCLELFRTGWDGWDSRSTVAELFLNCSELFLNCSELFWTVLNCSGMDGMDVDPRSMVAKLFLNCSELFWTVLNCSELDGMDGIHDPWSMIHDGWTVQNWS